MIIIKKTDLKEMKNRNKNLIIKTILSKGEISRIEISKITSLSPSTVSTLVNELIKEKILVENGHQSLKSGRSRTNISVNQSLGQILIISIKNKENIFTLFDLNMNKIFEKNVINVNNDGNLIISNISIISEKSNLIGIGILYEDDVIKEKYSILYGLEMSEEKILLSSGITSKFKIKVVEKCEIEYFVDSFVNLKKDNTLYINIGEEIICNLALRGNIIHLNNRMDAKLMEEVETKVEKRSLKNNISLVVSIILNVSMLFKIRNVVLIGDTSQVSKIKETIKKLIPGKAKPNICSEVLKDKKYIVDFAIKLRDDFLAEV